MPQRPCIGGRPQGLCRLASGRSCGCSRRRGCGRRLRRAASRSRGIHDLGEVHPARRDGQEEFHPAGAGRRRCRSLPSAGCRRWWREEANVEGRMTNIEWRMNSHLALQTSHFPQAGVVAERAVVAERRTRACHAVAQRRRANASFDDEAGVGRRKVRMGENELEETGNEV